MIRITIHDVGIELSVIPTALVLTITVLLKSRSATATARKSVSYRLRTNVFFPFTTTGGCDIVFTVYEKMKAFYPLLQPYFLDYDLAEMERRLQNRKQG